MAKRREAAEHLLRGLTPVQIAREMGITLSSVMLYLQQQIGEGAIQRSDIILSFPQKFRRAVERAVRDAGSDKRTRVQYRLRKAGISADPQELYLYLKLRREKVEYGDLYEQLRLIEGHLHSLARNALQRKHGDRWWRCLPVKVRQECSMVYEEDEIEAEHRYCCTTFIHLKVIYEKLWPELSPELPDVFTGSSDSKKRFAEQVQFINGVRNAVMHPVKGLRIEDESFRRVHQFAQMLVGKTPPSSDTWGSIVSMPVRSTVQ
jgi:hypothetical protein